MSYTLFQLPLQTRFAKVVMKVTIVTVIFLTGCISLERERNYAPVFTGGFVNQESSDARHHPGPIHQVVVGETLFSIASHYDIDYRQVAALNNLRPPYRIYSGNYLLLPEGTRPKTRDTTVAEIIADTETSIVEQPPVETVATLVEPAPSKWIIDTTITRRVEDIEWQWPAAGYDMRGFSARENRYGVDILGNSRDEIMAAADGRVVYAGENVPGYGKLILIKHDSDYLTAYAHNQVILVEEGKEILAGDTIARMGSTTDNETMLYFEIRHSGDPIDPTDVLPELNS